MKKIIAGMILAGFIFTGNAFAQVTRDDIVRSVCEASASMAEQIMRQRQNNMDLTELLHVIRTSNKDKIGVNLAISIAKEAYTYPLYSTPKYIERAIMDFKNKIHIECYKYN